MDVLIKHEGTTVTTDVVSYEREHRICTGIGTLRVVFEDTTAEDFSPGDTIDIHENGDFKVRYYVSDVSHSVPDAQITLECQDKSKYIVDYFIPESYTIEEPSYTRFWIEKFLDEAGVDYDFQTSGPGQLLSNFMQLGLQSAYDQVMQLLQLSGWYMFFDGNGTAIIGSLKTDLGSTQGTLNTTDITSASRQSDDKMLRNRAVVWGAYDPVDQEYAFADVTVHTPWNYNHNDLRTMVISNSNIPNRSSAFSIANTLLKEFARITVEKHIVATGARNFLLGDAIRVRSHVWSGKGVITTFGVSMSRDGLQTRIILDERCPRLFGFFDYGDYVYVSTFGDGVWRKHIRFDHTWEDFSDGFTDMRITDLHIADEVFSAVGASGEMYFNLETDTPWTKIGFDSLMSSADDEVPVGSGITNFEAYSGVMGRATIVDRDFHRVLYAVDTWSGLNMGDYYLTLSGLYQGLTPVGFVYSGTLDDSRGWIVSYDIHNGTFNEEYPISVSGNFNIRVFDVENDGKNDFVSVYVGREAMIPFYDIDHNFGMFTSFPTTGTNDSRNIVGIDRSDFHLEGESFADSLGDSFIVATYNNELIGEREIVAATLDGGDTVLVKKHYFQVMDEELGRTVIDVETTELNQTGTGLGDSVLGLSRESEGFYRIFHGEVSGSTSESYEQILKYRVWDIADNSVSADITLGTLTVPEDTNKTGFQQSHFQDSITIEDTIYTYVVKIGKAEAGVTADVDNYVKIYRQTCNMLSGTTSQGLIADIAFTSAEGTSPGLDWNIETLGGGGLPKWLFQRGNLPAIALFIREWDDHIAADASELNNYLIYSNDGSSFNTILIQSATDSTDPDFLLSGGITENGGGGVQLSSDGFLVYHRRIGGPNDGVTYAYQGESVSIVDSAEIPFHWRPSNVWPMFGSLSDCYIAKNGSDWYFINDENLNPISLMSFPFGYDVHKPFSMGSSAFNEFYWFATNTVDEKYEILRTSKSSVTGYIKPFVEMTHGESSKASIFGNFFVDANGSVLYLDNTGNDYAANPAFKILRRDEEGFDVLQEGAYPIRMDISTYLPLVTLQNAENTFNSFSIYENEVLQTTIVPTISGIVVPIQDYRYTLLDTVDSSSGVIGMSKQLLYLKEDDIWSIDATTFSGNMVLYENVPSTSISGMLGRIETSNYVSSGQYIFVTTSGEAPMFYQKDPEAGAFIFYSGLPPSRATMIRLDDRI